MYAVVRTLIHLLFRLLTDLQITGAENVPPSGPVLVTTNHLSQVDTPFLLVAIPRQVGVFVARKYRRNPLLRLLFEGMGGIWLRQAEADAEAMKAALLFLRSGGALGVAPEGTRSRVTHALQHALSGTAYLVSRSDAVVAPVAVWGTETAMHDLLHFRRPRIHARFGPAFRPTVSPHAKSAELESAMDEIMCAIAALLPAQYRGVYADHPGLVRWLEKTGS